MSATPMKGETAGTEIGYAKPRQEAGAMIRNSETLGCSVSARLKVQWELEREGIQYLYDNRRAPIEVRGSSPNAIQCRQKECGHEKPYSRSSQESATMVVLS